jgi:hypothetical protein
VAGARSGRRGVHGMAQCANRPRSRIWIAIGGLATFALLAAAPVGQRNLRAPSLPTHLSDGQFWALFNRLSEPSGYWNSDNLLSNEAGFQRVLPALMRRVGSGGVYLGVGPEQNFTYIAALHPAMAFVFDIRRGNALELLLYKALFELSPSRAEFVSRLFSRPPPTGIDSSAGPSALFAAYARVRHDSALYAATLRDALARLQRTHGFALSDDDRRGIAYMFRAFYDLGPSMDYDNMSGRGYRRGWRPTYADLMNAVDSAGTPDSYLATEANYRVVRGLEMRNLIVPVVGDFAGPKALRAVGAYVADHAATVGAFYTSNVEQYLFRDGGWRAFYANVAALPLDSSSTFIRAVFRSGMSGLAVGPGGSVTVLSSMTSVLGAVKAGRLDSYAALIQMSR